MTPNVLTETRFATQTQVQTQGLVYKMAKMFGRKYLNVVIYLAYSAYLSFVSIARADSLELLI